MDSVKCFRCGHQLIHEGSFTRDECYGDGEKNALVQAYHCPYCGMEYELCEPMEGECKDFPFYQDISNATK